MATMIPPSVLMVIYGFACGIPAAIIAGPIYARLAHGAPGFGDLSPPPRLNEGAAPIHPIGFGPALAGMLVPLALIMLAAVAWEAADVRAAENATSQDIIYPLQRPSLAAPVTRNALPHKLVTGTGVQIPWSPQDPAFGTLIRSNEPTVTRPHRQEPLSEGFLRAYWRFDS